MNSEFKETYKTGNYKWICKPGVRNEALDCTVYALTAVDIARLMTGNAAMNTAVEDIDIESIDEQPNELTLNSLLNEINTTNSEVPISNKKVIKRKLKRL
jgi:phage terminase large subunit GpA-like protein